MGIKIGILSDMHLGFEWGGPRQEDSFNAAKEAIEIMLNKNVDIIIGSGDIFDKAVVSPEILKKALDIFSKIRNVEKETYPRIIKAKKFDSSTLSYVATDKFFLKPDRLPVLAIHGTHERRSRIFTNPVQLLDAAEFLTYIHGDYLLIDIGGERVGILGIGTVPETHVAGLFSKIVPEALYSAYNIFVLHQNIRGFIYPGDSDSVLSLEDLPHGFDLIVAGHIHTPQIVYHPRSRTPVVFPGALIPTSLSRAEIEKERKIYIITINGKNQKIEEFSISHNRNIMVEEENVENKSPTEIRTLIERKIREKINSVREKNRSVSEKPVIKMKLKGLMKSGYAPEDIPVADIEKKFSDNAIVIIEKEIISEDYKPEIIEDLRRSSTTITEIALDRIKYRLKSQNLALSDNIIQELFRESIDRESGPENLLRRIKAIFRDENPHTDIG